MGRKFLRPPHARALSKSSEHRLEPWVAREIRECLILAKRHEYSLRRMFLELVESESPSYQQLRQSDLGQVLERFSELQRSVVPTYNWSIPDPIWKYKGYKQAVLALRGFLRADAENSPSHLTPEQRQGFAKLLESDYRISFWFFGAFSIFYYSVLEAIIYWILKRMGIIKTTTDKIRATRFL